MLTVELSHEQWTYVLGAMSDKAESYREHHVACLERRTQAVLDEMIAQLNKQLD